MASPTTGSVELHNVKWNNRKLYCDEFPDGKPVRPSNIDPRDVKLLKRARFLHTSVPVVRVLAWWYELQTTGRCSIPSAGTNPVNSTPTVRAPAAGRTHTAHVADANNAFALLNSKAPYKAGNK